MRHHYIAGTSALALICLCLLYIIFLTVPAHASSRNVAAALTPLDTSTVSPTDTTTPSPTDTSTPSPTVTNTPSPTDTTTPSPTVTNTPSPTDTTTPSPTVTTTPSPTVTSTASPSPTRPTTTPAPSPSSTRPVFPSPTTRATVGATTSPTGAASPGGSPTTSGTSTSTQAAGTNQGPGSSFTPDNSTGDSSNSADNPLVDGLLVILLGAGVSGLLALVFLAVRLFLRKRLIPLPSPKLPPSGAAPWSRSPAGVEPQAGQPFSYAQMGNDPFYEPDAVWNGNMAPGGQIPGNVSADMMVVSDSYPQAMLNQYSQQGQVVQHMPEEFSERW